MKEKTYAGRIKNSAAQYVKALYETKAGKTGKKTVGGDLRAAKPQ